MSGKRYLKEIFTMDNLKKNWYVGISGTQFNMELKSLSIINRKTVNDKNYTHIFEKLPIIGIFDKTG